MENKKQNAQPMSEWDRQVCVHLDDLWNKHHSGEMEAGDADVVFAKARIKIEQAIQEQKTQRAKILSPLSQDYVV